MILDDIVFQKRQEVTALKVRHNFQDLKKGLKKAPPLRNFTKAVGQVGLNLIAEVKQASPSKGKIAKKFDPLKIAKEYEKAGVAAISVLTDEKFFKGSLEHLKKVRKAVKLPILRKDFIIDEAQIYEARLAGADAVLLIVGILSARELHQFIALAKKLKMAALVEVHTLPELQKALTLGAQLIGINNRDLKTFKVDLNQTLKIMKAIPDRVRKKITIVSESGIGSRSDVVKLQAAGVNAILVGESLMRAKNKRQKVAELLHD